jgi:hypothetical protein
MKIYFEYLRLIGCSALRTYHTMSHEFYRKARNTFISCKIKIFPSSFAPISKTQSDTDHTMTQVIIHLSVIEEAQVQYQIRSGGTCSGESDPGTVTLPRVAFSPC